MHRLAGHLSGLLAAEGDVWPETLACLAGAANAEVAVAMAAEPSVVRLGVFGLLSTTVADGDPGALGERLAAAGFADLWTTSARRGGRLEGVVAVATRRAGGFSAEERAVLDGAAAVLTLALSRAAAEQERARSDERRRRLEARLEQIERQSTVGAVAAAVAHDLAAPISALLMEGSEIRKRVLELATMLPNAGPTLRNVIEDLRGLADHCLEASERARHLLTDFRLTARSGPEVGASTQQVQIGDALRSCVRMVRPLARDQVRVDLLVDAVPPLPGSRRRLEQAFTNLLVNAIHAASVREGRVGLVRARATQQGDEIIVEISDNGSGIPAEHKERIFEPFFSTKPPEQGTGLGLPITREIVEAHGGCVEVDSERGRGACFRVRLPLIPPARAAASRRPQVLIVNHDGRVAAAHRRALADGFEVLLVASPADALEALAADAAWGAVIVDLALPDDGAAELFAQIRRRWPALERRVIFGGRGSYASSPAFLSGAGNRCFQTPIPPEELRPLVESVVGAA
jgi:two-component system, NtrC family, sensor kinase